MTNGQPRRLTRSNDRRLGGVCGGLADYFDLDPTLVRVAYVALVLLGMPFALVGYFVLWIVMPAADPGAPIRTGGSSLDGGLFIGALLLVFGVVALLSRGWLGAWIGWGPLHMLGWGFYLLWPLALIGLGAFIILRTRERR